MTNDKTKMPSEADLDALLATIDHDLARSLEAAEGLPTAEREFARLYVDALHRVRRTLAMWQYEHAITDRERYRQILIALSGDMVISGLQAEAHRGKAYRTKIYLDYVRALFKRLIKTGAIAAPSESNQARVLDSNGVPFRRKH